MGDEEELPPPVAPPRRRKKKQQGDNGTLLEPQRRLSSASELSSKYKPPSPSAARRRNRLSTVSVDAEEAYGGDEVITSEDVDVTTLHIPQEMTTWKIITKGHLIRIGKLRKKPHFYMLRQDSTSQKAVLERYEGLHLKASYDLHNAKVQPDTTGSFTLHLHTGKELIFQAPVGAAMSASDWILTLQQATTIGEEEEADGRSLQVGDRPINDSGSGQDEPTTPTRSNNSGLDNPVTPSSDGKKRRRRRRFGGGEKDTKTEMKEVVKEEESQATTVTEASEAKEHPGEMDPETEAKMKILQGSIPFSEHVPFEIRACLNYLSQPATLKVEGLFRVPGSVLDIRALHDKFKQGERPDLSKVEDPGVVCGLLKLILRESPEIRVCKEDAKGMQVALNNEDENVARDRFKSIIENLPDDCCDTLKAIAYLFRKIVAQDGNRMTPTNLGSSVGLTLFPQLSVIAATKILTILIEELETIFPTAQEAEED